MNILLNYNKIFPEKRGKKTHFTICFNHIRVQRGKLRVARGLCYISLHLTNDYKSVKEMTQFSFINIAQNRNNSQLKVLYNVR